MSKYLSVPSTLLNDENVMKMLILIFPCSETRMPKKPYGGQRSLFASIFRENNYALREQFFNDPLLKYLWGKIFVVECPEICISHLRRIRSLPHYGEEKFNKLQRNMMQ